MSKEPSSKKRVSPASDLKSPPTSKRNKLSLEEQKKEPPLVIGESTFTFFTLPQVRDLYNPSSDDDISTEELTTDTDEEVEATPPPSPEI